MFVRGGISYYFPRLPWAFAKANCFFYLCWIDKQLISRFFFFFVGHVRHNSCALWEGFLYQGQDLVDS